MHVILESPFEVQLVCETWTGKAKMKLKREGSVLLWVAWQYSLFFPRVHHKWLKVTPQGLGLNLLFVTGGL